MAKAKKINCKFVQENGIIINDEFTMNEIKERMNWWVRKYKSVTFSKEKIKEYKY